MSIDTQAIIKEYQKDASDTGSADVQVAPINCTNQAFN